MYLLKRGHSLPTGNDRGEDVTLHGNTKGERDDIQKEEVGSLGGGGLAGENTFTTVSKSSRGRDLGTKNLLGPQHHRRQPHQG